MGCNIDRCIEHIDIATPQLSPPPPRHICWISGYLPASMINGSLEEAVHFTPPKQVSSYSPLNQYASSGNSLLDCCFCHLCCIQCIYFGSLRFYQIVFSLLKVTRPCTGINVAISGKKLKLIYPINNYDF